MVSAGGTLAIGFCSIPESSKNRYLGIWYNKVPSRAVAWIANRNTPLNDSSGVLKCLDSGNLVVKEDGSNDDDLKSFIWQSFGYPYDTLLPGMKLGSDLTTGLTRYLTSPISSDDPSEGNYTHQLDIVGYPQLCTRKIYVTHMSCLFKACAICRRIIILYVWIVKHKSWSVYLTLPNDLCDE
ncbi:S-locus-specific glycoprotein S13-like [Arachis stenosperma]|uniref:S-locus-specific glycoprotein S13-like n=1 Tax=Arachis stenosperma TaxID=217475 RepID=UPI0025ACC21A|nr:S-locus-specific glycoprotein S13-like [Arachis stenosperma]